MFVMGQRRKGAMENGTMILLAFDAILFIVALYFVLLYSRPVTEIPRQFSEPTSDSTRTIPSVSSRTFDESVSDYVFIGKNMEIYKKGHSVNGESNWTQWGFSDNYLVFLRESDEMMEISIHDNRGLLHTSVTDFPLTNKELVSIHGNTLFISQVGRVLAFRIQNSSVKHCGTLDPNVVHIYHMVIQDDGLLILWCGRREPTNILTYIFDHGFIRRDEGCFNGEAVRGDESSHAVSGRDWYALDTIHGLYTTKEGEIPEKVRGTLHAYEDHLIYDRPNTVYEDSENREGRLVSLGKEIVYERDGRIHRECYDPHD